LEQRYQLRPLGEGPDERGLWRYQVPNIYDAQLWDLRGSLENADSSEGFDWEQLERLRTSWLVPTRDAAERWLLQMALLIPILLLLSAGFDALRARREGRPIPLDALQIAAAAVFLVVAESSILREAAYVTALVPAIAALGARLIVGRRSGEPSGHPPIRVFVTAARWGGVALLLIVTSIATFAYTRDTGIYNPSEPARRVGPALAEMMTFPPIDGYEPGNAARAADRQMWDTGRVRKARVLTRYMHDCTATGDRLLVTGSTPYHVNYYANRSVAGGHVFWHYGYLSDPVRQQELLALLRQQSVPFAFSTHDPVLEDLKRYPMIREYMLEHYVELEGTDGLVLVDSRREPTSQFGRLGFPCFR
jgi:hypothetical protein